MEMRVKIGIRDLSKVNLKKVYESQFEEKWESSEMQT